MFEITKETIIADIMMNAPGEVTQAQLDELHIAINIPEAE